MSWLFPEQDTDDEGLMDDEILTEEEAEVGGWLFRIINWSAGNPIA